MRGCRLLYFVKSKSGTKCKNFAVLLCFYVNTFILLQFLRWQEGGGYSPPSHPPKSATGYTYTADLAIGPGSYVLQKSGSKLV